MTGLISMMVYMLISIIVFTAIIYIVIMVSRIKKVPANTTIIIDRNTHFHKKKRHGYYFFNPKIDKITTMVSAYPIEERYINVFKTHEDSYYNVNFTMTYVSNEPEQTLDSLSDSRRSIYDIANCAVETLFGTLTRKEIATTTLEELNTRLFHQLESTLEYFYIDVTEARIINYSLVGEEEGKYLLFNRHESSGGNPIQ